MGSERSPTTRMRLAGKICCLCGRHLDTMRWQPSGERVFEACEAKRSTTPQFRRIHVSFVLRDRWYCTFMEGDLRTTAAPDRTFTNADKMVEMIRRGNGLRELASKQAVEHGKRSDRGNEDLLLTDEQYSKLARKL
jgi:hypothetical protein